MGTAVIYARFSSSKQREASIEDQLRVCNEWCQREGYEVVRAYCDYAISGRTDDRPEFQRMIENAGESEIVLVYMMDRFSRDPYDAPIYKKRLRDRGVRVVSATESMPDGPEAILIEKVYEGIAAIESANIAKRTRRGMHGNALKCLHNGVRVFGYRVAEDGTYEVDEDEAEVVREVFGRRRLGESMSSIANDIRKRGYKTYAGNPVGYTWVETMIKNEKYTGVYIFGDVRVEGGMPKIIDRSEWLMVQGVRGKKQRAKEVWRDYPLSGRTFCAGCGGKMDGYCAYGRYHKRYDYYRCATRCGARFVRADWLEGSIVEAIRLLLSDRERTMEVARSVATFASDDGTEARLEAARARHEKAMRSMDNLYVAVSDGMPWKVAEPLIEQQKETAKLAVAEIAALESADRFSVEDFANFLQFGATLDDEHLLDAFVGQVLVDDEEVIVKLNYRLEDSETRKFEPASLKLDRVRTEMVWLPIPEKSQTTNMQVRLGVSSKDIYFKLRRAA